MPAAKVRPRERHADRKIVDDRCGSKPGHPRRQKKKVRVSPKRPFPGPSAAQPTDGLLCAAFLPFRTALGMVSSSPRPDINFEPLCVAGTSTAREIIGANGMAQIGPTVLAPVIDHAHGAHIGLEA